MTFTDTDPLNDLELKRVYKQYPFENLIEKYYTRGYPLTEELLDELAVDLETSPYMKQLQTDLKQSPALSALYRYDPFSITYSDTWGGRTSHGPKQAWLRMFKDLTFDKVKVARIEGEVLVVIDQPSVLVRGLGAGIEVNEPTVLFTSHIFKGSAIDLTE